MLIAFALLVVGLWPFSSRPKNGVGWIKGRPGLWFQPRGMVYDPEPIDWSGGASPDQSATVTIELWLEPFQEPDDNVLNILTIDDGVSPSGIALAQWRTELLLRRRDPAGEGGYREVGADGALIKHTPRSFTVTADPAGTAFYLDGNLLLRRPGFVLSASRLKGHLILGDAAEGGHAWAGQLFGLAWFHRALDAAEIARHQALWTNHQANQLATATGLSALYLFDEGSGQWVLDRSPKGRRLWIPERYRVLEKTVLAPPWGSTPLQWSDVDDILINILGFVPFGFMVYSHRRLTRPNSRTWNVLWAVAAGTAISLAIELIQVWLPNRSSSATDLASDTLGTLIGVLIARRMFARPPVA